MIGAILALTSVGLGCGVLILIVSKVLPPEPESFRKVQELTEHLPGLNCGACGAAGCFAYAQALAIDKEHFNDCPCPGVLQDDDMLEALQEALDLKIDASAMGKKAFISCAGDNEIIGLYNGVNSCKTSALLLSGFKQCPYGCFGLGDCATVCPEDAIVIDPERHVAKVDWEKCIGCGLCVIECPHNLITLVSSDAKLALTCNYLPIRDIPGRGKCDRGCLHCRKCVRACDYNAIEWDKDKGIPIFNAENCVLCGACIEVCNPGAIIQTTNEALHPELIKEKPKPKPKPKAVAKAEA